MIEVQYPGPKPQSRNRKIYVRTKPRGEFLNAVREHASQAIFEDASAVQDKAHAA